ncbi:MAG: glycosyltransferase [Rhodobacteraceae bacterium]|nr:glycosyltransferase [Paracoccaceae bacterium]
MIHDTIPLDFPQFQRPGEPENFAQKLDVAAGADVVLFPTEAARDEARPHFEACGGMPPSVIAHLGVPRPDPRPDEVPYDLPRDRPYFVILGTIEPRKNHALLLDIWEKFHATRPGAEIPYLFILGSRGWNNEEIFERLKNAPFMGRTAFECPGLSDAAVAALLEGAAALLQPSYAEGFGLPPVEAAALGTPVVCAPLPVFKETLGDIPVYASLSDSYLWETIIDRLSAPEATGRAKPDRLSVLPTWDDHFKKVLAQI